jgi:hypothetical protein
MSDTNTGEFTMSGVETLHIKSAGNTANTVNLANVTGLTTVVLDDNAGTANHVNIDGAASGLTIDIGVKGGADYAGKTVDVDLANASGSSDSITVNLANTTTSSGATIDTTGIETVNLVATAGGSAVLAVSVAGTVTAGTINVSGTSASDDVTLESIASGYTTVNAASLAGALTIAASARGSDAMTITAGANNDDSIAMENAADVLDGGAGTNDTLTVVFTGNGGTVIADLSSTTDQVSQLNGVANAAVQKGFENIDLSGITSTGSFGADITGSSAANTITGTAYADTIRAGAGVDTIIVATAGAGDNDIVDGGDGTDTLHFAAGNNVMATDANLVNVGVITLGATANINLTGQTEGFTITGGTGANTIVGGAGDDSINLTVDTATDTVGFASTAVGNGADTITGFLAGAVTGGDKLNFEAFLAAASTTVDVNSGAAGAITTYNAASAGDAVISNKIALFDDGGTALTVTTLLSEFTASSAAFAAGTTKAVVLSGDAGTVGSVLVFYVDVSLGASASTLDAGDIVLVGTLTGVDIDVLTTANFAVA